MEKTIKVPDEVHKELGRLGTTRESYADVIKKLINFWKEEHKK